MRSAAPEPKRCQRASADSLRIRILLAGAARSSDQAMTRVLTSASEHIQHHRKSVAQRGLRCEAELFGCAARVAHRDSHLAAACRPTMHDKRGSAQRSHGLGETADARRLAGADIEDGGLGGRQPHCLPERANCIADISKVTGLVAIAENLHRFSAKQLVGENRDNAGIWGKRILARTVKVKETQPDGRNAVYGSGHAGVEFAGVLVRTVCAQRRHGAFLVDRCVTAIAIHRRSRGIDDRNLPPATGRSGLIEHVDRSGEIDLVGLQPLAVRPPDGRNRRQMKTAIHAAKRVIDSLRIGHVSLGEVGSPRKIPEEPTREIVKNPDCMTLFQQRLNQMRAKKPAPPVTRKRAIRYP